MAQTNTSDTYHKTVYITDIQDDVDFDKKYLSCGIYRKWMLKTYEKRLL
jgi:hypothetical protein